MNTIHVKGWADKIELDEELENSCGFPVSFMFDESSDDVVENVFIRFYDTEKECSLEQAMKGHLRRMFGNMELTGSEYGYSEYTVEGFCIEKMTLGGHDLDKIIKSKVGRYIHILIDQVNF